MSRAAYMRAALRRFEAMFIPTDSCWQWIAYLRPDGYAVFRFAGRMVSAHRFSYMVAYGAIPEGLHLDHLCRNRGCVRPDHLEAVTPRENILRGNGYTARAARGEWLQPIAPACPRGHPRTPEHATSYISPRTERLLWRCTTCRRMWNAALPRRVRQPRPLAPECQRGHPKTPEHGSFIPQRNGPRRWQCNTCQRIRYAARRGNAVAKPRMME